MALVTCSILALAERYLSEVEFWIVRYLYGSVLVGVTGLDNEKNRYFGQEYRKVCTRSEQESFELRKDDGAHWLRLDFLPLITPSQRLNPNTAKRYKGTSTRYNSRYSSEGWNRDHL